jgi:hypothetical protein
LPWRESSDAASSIRALFVDEFPMLMMCVEEE